MPADSLQHKMDQGRVRPPRVQITYDVETEGATVKTELPFVVGVLADLSGQPKEPLKGLVDRKFVPIDRDNFNDVLARATPRVAIKVPNRLSGDNSMLGAELNFRSMEDFEPARVAEQIEPLKELLQMRRQLKNLISRLEGNPKLEKLMEEVMQNTDMKLALAREMGIEAPGADNPAATNPEETK